MTAEVSSSPVVSVSTVPALASTHAPGIDMYAYPLGEYVNVMSSVPDVVPDEYGETTTIRVIGASDVFVIAALSGEASVRYEHVVEAQESCTKSTRSIVLVVATETVVCAGMVTA